MGKWETERETETERDTETERQRQRETEKRFSQRQWTSKIKAVVDRNGQRYSYGSEKQADYKGTKVAKG
jgi:alpha-tubulin suppressor-like RCC1 family protein